MYNAIRITGRNRLYHLPLLENTSTASSASSRSRRSSKTSRSERCKTSPNDKQYSANRNHINLPEIASNTFPLFLYSLDIDVDLFCTEQTAGIRTIDTIGHAGFAKGMAASRYVNGADGTRI